MIEAIDTIFSTEVPEHHTFVEMMHLLQTWQQESKNPRKIAGTKQGTDISKGMEQLQSKS